MTSRSTNRFAKERARLMLGRRTFNRLIAVASLGVFGCGRDEGKHVSAPTGSTGADSAGATSRPGTLRYLALGDSYTIGESVPASQRWPVQLAEALRGEGIEVGKVEIIARTGWRTDDLDAAITRNHPQGPYDLVSLLIGVNNQYQGRPLDQYRKEFPALLNRAIGLAGSKPEHVIVLSIPDYGATPFGQNSGDPSRIGGELDKYNAIAKAACAEAHVAYVDITPISRTAAQDKSLIADDGLHPSGKMYAQWVKLALPEARAALGKSDVAPGKPGG
jgi:lysophospholipase L1-like esterase